MSPSVTGYNRQLACKDEHVGNDRSPYAKPQPEIGQYWCKVQKTSAAPSQVKIHYLAVV